MTTSSTRPSMASRCPPRHVRLTPPMRTCGDARSKPACSRILGRSRPRTCINGREIGEGRIDHLENRLIGIKSREVYEAPAAVLLLQAHQALEDITMPKEVARF